MQGLTELVPISFSAHLRVTAALLGWRPARGVHGGHPAFVAYRISLGTLLLVLLAAGALTPR
ncbi:hypothetical protein [Quadrisphaera granulorum]|uniref:hypothetical protein n=1 Tax=Quadrisphaera granulorum TaxID=317664 RepID=UPI000D6D7B18|nr:hypothetical protein [Quadrisphaera granulorum]